MFVQRIGSLDKTRFGINFKIEDIKCKIEKSKLKNKKEKEIKNN